ncbi:MAG: sodium:calcium antiporter [Alphaproteobacteria bacterium]
MTFDPLPIEAVYGLFALAAAVICGAGTMMAGLADRLADRTGLGEAVAGAMLLGVSTSLSGTVTSVTAALDGAASLAVANAVGGIGVQTVFLVLADLTYRRINLEHAAADANHLLQAALLLLLLSLPLVAYLTPAITVWAVHPVSLALPVIYVFGMRASVDARHRPMWRPERTADTHPDEPAEAETGWSGSMPLLLKFCALAAVLSAAGWLIAVTGQRIAASSGLSQSLVGAALTATATSLPELVTTLAAVRRGALQLAVGGIIGGNTFDVLFLSLSDAAYREGSIYHAMAGADALLFVSVMTITAILLMGLVLRERKGIGFEGVTIIAVYLGSMALQAVVG